ncbi:c-type cytochrome [Sphingomonas montana]|uniref:c-type cytochrome n=1 Tax=Sphingomonas montana TaxID=1843236 RepID=UPI00096D1903|nr:cytochrome c family protein [Sphingomonas montana]
MTRVPLLLIGGTAMALVATLLFVPHGPARRTGPVAASLDGRLAAADAGNGARIFRRCAACHTVGANGGDTDGPNLHGVVGQPIARRRPRFAYTASLAAVGGTWTPTRLDAWLANPRAVAPGTSMAFAGLPDPQDRADVIAYLRTR